MPNSRAEIHLHFVWCTHGRLPLIAVEFEPALYQAIRTEVRVRGCQTLALGGIADHLHLVVKMPTRISPAALMKQVKGASSRFVNQFFPRDQHFAWQEGYGVFSISRSHLARVVQNVEHQVPHHTHGRLWPEWEETGVEEPTRR